MQMVIFHRAIRTTLFACLLSAYSVKSASTAELTEAMNDDEKVSLSSRWDLGYYLFQVQEYDAAALEFEKLRLILPADASLLALIGSCYSMAGRWQAAESALLQALKGNPEDEDINGLIGQFYLSAGRPLKAVSYMEHSLRILPKQDELRARLVKVYLEVGNIEGAYTHLNLLLDASGGYGFDNPELENDYAQCLIQFGKFRDALVYAERAYRNQPGNSEFSRIYGICLLGNNLYEEASKILVVGQQDFQFDANLYLQLGEAQFMGRHWVEAEKTWLDGVTRYPNSYSLFLRLLEYYVGTAQPERARRVVAFAEQRNPENPGNLLLEAHLKRKLSNFTSASKSLERLKRQSCGTLAMEAIWEEAQLDFVTGKYSSCDKLLDNLLFNRHRQVEAHLMKAKLANQTGNKTKVQAETLAARNANPYNLNVYALAHSAFTGSAELAKLTQH
jgi:tetratricopeptide (TPR) repeat protein